MRVICVDDEPSSLEFFRHSVRNFPEIESLMLFSVPIEAIRHAENNKIDIAFLDICFPDTDGIALAKALHQIDENIRIIFVTAHEKYAMQAFRVDAVGYVLKPYTTEDIRHEFDKALRLEPAGKNVVTIDTIPDFVVKVRGKIAVFNRPKVEELFALLIDHGDAGVTVGEAIANLWPDRPSDEATGALYRTTSKRLLEVLKGLGIGDIICTDGRRRYIDTKMVDCDLYHILAGEKAPLLKYNGEYMRRFSWAEDRNAWLWHLDMEHIRET